MLKGKLLSDQAPQLTPDIAASQQYAAHGDMARAPVKEPEAVNAGSPSSSDNEQKEKAYDRVKGKASGLRRWAIQATPGFVVNNSSNILGAMHVATEVMMLKASSASSTKDVVAKKSNIIEQGGKLVYDTFKGSIVGSKPQHKFGEVTKDGFFKGIKNYLTDTNAAAKYEYDHVKKNSVANTDYKPGNRWQNRSTLFGLIVWTLSALIPDKKEDPDEVEKMTELQQKSILGYVGERVKQGLWAPDWGAHKRQMIGLGVTLSGVCSILGAWRRRDPLAAAEVVNGMKYTYKLDKSYLMQSSFTLGSGLALLLSIDDERGFSRFGMGMMGRLMFLPATIAGKYGWEKEKGAFKWNKVHEGEPGRGLYTASTASFQLENMAQGLIGGAEKNEDGTIVDHEAVRKEAKLRATIKMTAKKTGEPINDDEVEARLKRIHEAKGSNKPEMQEAKPSNSILKPIHISPAMPEKLAQAEQALQGV